jgi:hypothetical protein
LCDGAAKLTLNGGNGPFTFHWNNNQIGVLATELCAGNYTVTITDAGGCPQTKTTQIAQPPALNFSVDQLINDNGNGTGLIQIAVTGGTPPYHYLWTRNGQIFGNSKNLSNLTPGQYVVIVTDANGCTMNSDPLVITKISATEMPAWAEGLILQPNPASEEVQLIMDEPIGTPATVRLNCGTGEIFHEFIINPWEKTIAIDLTGIASGLWFVQITTATGQQATRKLIITR